MNVTVQEHSGSRARPLTESQLEPYDFRRRSTLARESAKALGVAFESFARQWSTQLTAKVRVVSDVAFDAVDLTSYDEYASSLPKATVMALCAIEGHATRAVVQIPIPSARAWIGRMLGATTPVDDSERILTPIERALVRRLIDEAIEDLRYCFGELLPARVDVTEIHFNAQFAQAGATSDPMVVASFTISVGESSSAATIAMPADALLPQLGHAALPGSAISGVELMRDQISRVPVDVSVEFASAGVRPGFVLDLEVGDLVPIPHPHHRPLELRVDGRSFARAAVGTSGSRLAVVVVSTEEIYP